jgi:DNA mismatch endonuclease (patch repair protein)
MENSACCKIPKTNHEFWVSKIKRNKERDKEEQRKLAAMGWHCITVWECELKPQKREETLDYSELQFANSSHTLSCF